MQSAFGVEHGETEFEKSMSTMIQGGSKAFKTGYKTGKQAKKARGIAAGAKHMGDAKSAQRFGELADTIQQSGRKGMMGRLGQRMSNAKLTPAGEYN